ncbi:hypothetical protein BC833DRAFT_594708 [Globomyces pollinis-pini]|nr:hypothetical protein BC833DRAFT_594708 [Globomyces pollinis-pini]
MIVKSQATGNAKIIFLFLAHDGIQNQDLWQDFFSKTKTGREFGLILFVNREHHRKRVNNFFRQFLINSPLKKCEYGNIIPGYLVLMQEAIARYPNLQQAYCIPGNCLPIRPVNWYAKELNQCEVCFDGLPKSKKKLEDYWNKRISKSGLVTYSNNYSMVRETIDFMIKNKTELTRYQPVHGYYPDEFAMFTLLKYKDFELFTKSLKPTFEFICYAEYVEEENPTFGDRVSTCRAIEFGTVEEFQRALSLAMAGESTGFIRKISDGLKVAYSSAIGLHLLK